MHRPKYTNAQSGMQTLDAPRRRFAPVTCMKTAAQKYQIQSLISLQFHNREMRLGFYNIRGLLTWSGCKWHMDSRVQRGRAPWHTGKCAPADKRSPSRDSCAYRQPHQEQHSVQCVIDEEESSTAARADLQFATGAAPATQGTAAVTCTSKLRVYNKALNLESGEGSEVQGMAALMAETEKRGRCLCNLPQVRQLVKEYSELCRQLQQLLRLLQLSHTDSDAVRPFGSVAYCSCCGAPLIFVVAAFLAEALQLKFIKPFFAAETPRQAASPYLSFCRIAIISLWIRALSPSAFNSSKSSNRSNGGHSGGRIAGGQRQADTEVTQLPFSIKEVQRST